ncbi:MAG: hypothetical protein ACXABY_18760 [Candidatus Thorarchaeota archaeon]|jgi:hypothetical protein
MPNYRDYVCSVCGAGVYYDGRCGDGPVLMCRCDEIGSTYVKDRMGGYHTNPTGAKPVPKSRGPRGTTVIVIHSRDNENPYPA